MDKDEKTAKKPAPRESAEKKPGSAPDSRVKVNEKDIYHGEYVTFNVPKYRL